MGVRRIVALTVAVVAGCGPTTVGYDDLAAEWAGWPPEQRAAVCRDAFAASYDRNLGLRLMRLDAGDWVFLEHECGDAGVIVRTP